MGIAKTDWPFSVASVIEFTENRVSIPSTRVLKVSPWASIKRLLRFLLALTSRAIKPFSGMSLMMVVRNPLLSPSDTAVNKA